MLLCSVAGPAAAAQSASDGKSTATSFAWLSPGPDRAQPPTDEDAPWRLGPALGAPEWLTLEGSQQWRFETLDEDFRANRSGHNQLIALRTLLKAVVRQEQFSLVAEFMDARQIGAPSKGFLSTAIVNAAELLQAHVALTFDDVFGAGDELAVLFGRHTMDIGSRRLVARNIYRNTINAFTGVNAVWTGATGATGATARAFFTLPIQRLPNDAASLRDNDVAFDEERKQVKFFGLTGTTAGLGAGFRAQGYALGLDERDGRNLATRDRSIYTVGARIRRAADAGEPIFEAESAYQFGQSRATAGAADRTDLDHSAHFHHVTAGYRFDLPCDPRFEALFAYASGDESPNDGDNNRFDSLFGAPVPDWGPTSIFGPFGFQNQLAPGYRVSVDLWQDARLMLMHRFHYLASDRDAWPQAGIQDPNGDSGRYIGHLLNARVRWDPKPQNLRFECGIGHLFADGDFPQDAPGSPGVRDATLFYAGLTLWF